MADVLFPPGFLPVVPGVAPATPGAPLASTGGDINLPIFAKDTPYFSEIAAIWPDLYNQKAQITPVGNGVNRYTGQLLSGFRHVEQSLETIFATPFHERVLRRWVGSFVPMLLGETYVARIVTRFYWAIATSIDLFEPRYRIKVVFYMGNALSEWAPKTLDAVALIRLGEAIFRNEGVYYPRGHLGDFTPYERKFFGLAGRGGNLWDVTPVTPIP
jgi:hypothetical protein